MPVCGSDRKRVCDREMVLNCFEIDEKRIIGLCRNVLNGWSFSLYSGGKRDLALASS